MEPSPRVLLVLVTAPAAEAARIARALVDERVAACVSQLPAVTSVYRWQGGVEEASETLLLIKTDEAHYAALESAVHRVHPYEVPEVIALPIERGSAAYLQWISGSLA